MISYPTIASLNCDSCGEPIPGNDPRPGYYSDGEEIRCATCGAVNFVSVDTETEPCVIWHRCRHGKHSDDPCDECEIEDGAGIGEVTP